MKLLFCINDDRPDNLPVTRQVFKRFVQDGLLSDYKEYGYKPRIRHLGSITLMELELLKVIKNYKPEVIHFNQLNYNYQLSDKFINTCRIINPDVILTQESVDAFHRLPKAMFSIVNKFDITLTNCGNLVDAFNKKYPAKTYLFPEKISLREERLVNNKKKYDLIMIASNNVSKKPHNFSMGVIDRLNIVRKFSKEKNINFAVFGNGWNWCRANKSFLPFHDQLRIMRQSRLLIGANLYRNYNYYFSNRIPNSMLSGVPLIHKYSKGLDSFFADKEHIFYYKNINEAKRLVLELLNWPQYKLDEIGNNAKQLVLQKHTAEIRYRYYLKLVNAFKNGSLENIEPEYFLEKS